MIIFGKKRYEILPADSPLLKGKTFQKTDKLKFILGEDIMQGSILKAVIPAGGIVVTRNESHTICVENFAQKSEVYIALDERLWSIEFPEGTVVSEEARQSSGGSAAPIELQDKTFTENGTYTADAGYSGLGNVTVDVASSGGVKDIILLRDDRKVENMICSLFIDDVVLTNVEYYESPFDRDIVIPTNVFDLMADIINSGSFRFVSLFTHSNEDVIRISTNIDAYLDSPYPYDNYIYVYDIDAREIRFRRKLES